MVSDIHKTNFPQGRPLVLDDALEGLGCGRTRKKNVMDSV